MVEQPAVNRLVVGSSPTCRVWVRSDHSGSISSRTRKVAFILGRPTTFHGGYASTTRLETPPLSPTKTALGPWFGRNNMQRGRRQCCVKNGSSLRNRPGGFVKVCSTVESRQVGINRLVVGGTSRLIGVAHPD